MSEAQQKEELTLHSLPYIVKRLRSELESLKAHRLVLDEESRVSTASSRGFVSIKSRYLIPALEAQIADVTDELQTKERLMAHLERIVNDFAEQEKRAEQAREEHHD